MYSVGQLLQRCLRSARVPSPALSEAVGATVCELWPGMDAGRVSVLGLRGGVLHVVLDTQARTSEARTFFAARFRESVNEHLARTAPAGPRQESLYVAKISFHVPGGR
jgi:hypothetical protein